MSVFNDNESEISNVINEIIEILRRNEFVISRLVFEELITNYYINESYAQSQLHSEMKYINRHDKLHALNVTLFSIKLYELLKNENSLRLLSSRRRRSEFGFSILARCLRDPAISINMAEDLTCTSIVFSSYCHDIFKYMGGRHNLSAAIYVPNIAQCIIPHILSPETIELGYEMLLIKIQSAIEKHDGNVRADFAEEGIVMLADILDNDENRIIESDLKDVIIHDKKPIEYFSCKNITHPIIISEGVEKRVNVIVNLKGDAGWHHVREMYNVLNLSGLINLISLVIFHPEFERKIVLV